MQGRWYRAWVCAVTTTLLINLTTTFLTNNWVFGGDGGSDSGRYGSDYYPRASSAPKGLLEESMQITALHLALLTAE